MAKRSEKLPPAVWKPTRTLGEMQDSGCIPDSKAGAMLKAQRYGITLAQLLFIAYYVHDGCSNATDAYMKVHPKVQRGSAQTASSRWLSNDMVKHALATEVDNAINRLAVSRANVLGALGRALSDDKNPNHMRAVELCMKFNGMLVSDRNTAVQVNVDTAGTTTKHISIDDRVCAVLNDKPPVVEGTAKAVADVEDIEDAEIEA